MAAPAGDGVSGTSVMGVGGRGVPSPPLGVTVPQVGTQGVPTLKIITGRLLGGLERRACTTSAETALLKLGETGGRVKGGPGRRCECLGRTQRPGSSQQKRHTIGGRAWELLRQGVMGVSEAIRQRVTLQHRELGKDSETQGMLEIEAQCTKQAKRDRAHRALHCLSPADVQRLSGQ